MKKQIAIVTILDRNYGNRLQNFALQNVVKQLGYKVVTIDTRQKVKFYHVKNSIKTLLLKAKYNRIQPFWVWEVFDYKYIAKAYINLSNLQAKSCRFDKIIVGSDQVWNPILYYFKPEYMFLEFAKSNQKVAYAASIGINSVPKEWVAKFKKGLNDFSAISMREIDGAITIESIVNRPIPVVLDPTMLITRDVWSNLADKSNVKKKNKYILKYYLGKKNDSIDNAISQYAVANEYEVVDLMGGKLKNIGPIEFLWFIKNCEMMFTDSFHGSVFSILFHKNFWIFERPAQNDTGEMNSRLHTLVTHFDIQDRMLKVNDFNYDINFEQKINFEKIDYVLMEKRKQSFEYLQSILE